MVDVCFWAHRKAFSRKRLWGDLDPRIHQRGDGVVFDFSMWVRYAATSDDIEDVSRWWTRPQERIVRLGGIAIPKQIFLTQNQLYDCEYMVFNPWNCLPKHMLGSVNRMRLAVYLASSAGAADTEHGAS